MAPGQKLYPRATVKKIVKAHSNCNVSKNVDVTVSWRVSSNRSELELTWADLSGLCPLHANVSALRLRILITMSSLNFSLMKEAAIDAKQGGERGITARSVKKVTAVSPADQLQLAAWL